MTARARDSESTTRVALVGDAGALGVVGHTPLLRLGRLEPEGGGSVWAKAEFLNPGGSV
jgi:cysteine synthase